jgi:transcriptional regulator with XRE-family HTH domain
MTDHDRQRAIGARIREARRLAGLSQGQVARMLNLHRPSVSGMEAGTRRVTAEEVSRLAALFDVGVSYLTGDTPDRLISDDPKLQLAFREIQKLSPEAQDRLLRALTILRGDDEAGG